MTHYYLLNLDFPSLYKLDSDGNIWGWDDKNDCWTKTYFTSNVNQMSGLGMHVNPQDLVDHPAFKKERFYKDVLSESKSE